MKKNRIYKALTKVFHVVIAIVVVWFLFSIATVQLFGNNPYWVFGFGILAGSFITRTLKI